MRILERQVDEPALQNVTENTNTSTLQLQHEIDQYLQSQGANQVNIFRFAKRNMEVASRACKNRENRCKISILPFIASDTDIPHPAQH